MMTSAGRNCAIGSRREKSDLGRDSAPLSPAIEEGEWGESVMLLKGSMSAYETECESQGLIDSL